MVVVTGILLKKHIENKQNTCCKNTSPTEAIKSTVEGGGNGDQKCFEVIVCRVRLVRLTLWLSRLHITQVKTAN